MDITKDKYAKFTFSIIPWWRNLKLPKGKF